MTELSPAARHLQFLIQCQSVTPIEGGALTYLQEKLQAIGFETNRMVFSDKDTPDVDNLYARWGTGRPHVMFAGHTDVVPVGDENAWSHPPFSGDVIDGVMYGRGTVDMKGGIACFLASVETFLRDTPNFDGSISFLITGDEEGPSINGTDKLLKWAAEKQERWDACIVGEPANPNAMGDAIKIGRRGSTSGQITVKGIQGHSAYPHLADNPVRGLMDLLDALLATPFDNGTKDFQQTNLEVTTIDVGNTATNVIPAEAKATFNIRFNETWPDETVHDEIMKRLNEGAKSARIRNGKEGSVVFSVKWLGRVSPVFLTRDDALIRTLSTAINSVTGKTPELSTGGGTSDARFIKDYCPVVEFGLVGQTMHQVDERTPIADVDTLTEIYGAFLREYFK